MSTHAAIILASAAWAALEAAPATEGTGPTARADAPAQPAPAAATETVSSSNWTVFPLISVAPETSLLFSGLAIYVFPDAEAEKANRPERSNLNFMAAYTLKNQFVTSIAPTIYLDEAKWRINGALQAVLFPDTLYALGPDSPASSAEKFSQRGIQLLGSVERRVLGPLRAGAQLVAFDTKVTERETGGLLDQKLLVGSDGGSAVGVGPLLVVDNRDREFAPRHGGRHALSYVVFPRVGTDFSFAQATADLRQYASLPWSERQVLAAQVFAQASTSGVPFQAMPTLAGDGRMRGFFAGRFRDTNAIIAQLEYRVVVWRRLGLAAFGGLGNVASRVADLDLRHPKAAGGGGIRVLLDRAQSINVRLDVGTTSTGDTNIYLALGEAF